jgi:hypothetical protein
MLIRDRRHPHGYHVDRHPPRRVQTVTHWMLIALAAFGVCLFLLLQLYSNG